MGGVCKHDMRLCAGRHARGGQLFGQRDIGLAYCAVVAAIDAGYADSVEGDHGVFLVGSQEQALSALSALSADPGLRHASGQKARDKVMALQNGIAVQNTLENYLN